MTDRGGSTGMTELLLRLFVKAYKNTEDAYVRAAVGKLAGAVGIVCNGLLFLAKLTAGLLAGSVSVIADAVNNLSDAASSVVTLLGFRLAQRPADADHPYGHARYEYLSGFLVAVLILVIGVELVKSSVEKILHPEAVDFSALTIAVLIGSVLVKLWMSLFFRGLGKRIHSLTLEATAVDSRNDVITTAAVLLGCMAGIVFHVNLDGYIGLLVAVFILVSGWKVLQETISPLLGQKAEEGLVEQVQNLLLSEKAVLGVHDLLIHDYGPGRCFASIHAEIDAKRDPPEVHTILDGLENRALAELKVHLVIHHDPVLVDDAEWNEMRQVVQEIMREIAPMVSMHSFRLVRCIGQKQLAFDLLVPYDAECSQERIRQEVAQELLARGKEYGTLIRFDGKE